VVQGRDEDTARKLLDDAVALEAAGLLRDRARGRAARAREGDHCASHDSHHRHRSRKHCDGQVLVCYDLLGMNPDFKPKFVKRYADGFGTVKGAAAKFFEEVREHSFPDEDHSFRSSTMRLVASNPDVVPTEREDKEKSGIYGVPV